jgi:hypothetical protein
MSLECPRCWRVDSHSLACYFASHPKPRTSTRISPSASVQAKSDLGVPAKSTSYMEVSPLRTPMLASRRKPGRPAVSDTDQRQKARDRVRAYRARQKAA